MNPGDKEAEEKFKEIKEANEVLSDPEKKASYDQFGFAGTDPNYGSGQCLALIHIYMCIRDSYYGGGTAVQVQKGTLIINGGTFACEPYSNPTYGYNFLINCVDKAYKLSLIHIWSVPWASNSPK